MVRKSYFKCRVTEQWNNLPESIVEAPSINAFKNRLDEIWKKDDIMFDVDINLREITSSHHLKYRTLK